MADGGHTPKESPDAVKAFADYYELGASRSLEKLLDRYRSGTEPAPTRRMTTLKTWSTTFGWQDRIRAITQEQLASATEIDGESFVITSRKLRERLDITDPLNLTALIKIRESVRPATAKEVKVTGADGGPLVVQFEVVPSRIGEGE